MRKWILGLALFAAGCGDANELPERPDLEEPALKPDLGAPPTPNANGTRIVATTSHVVFLGTTSDQQLAFLEKDAVRAVPLAGGPTTTIADYESYGVFGNLVAVWSKADDGSLPLTLWRAGVMPWRLAESSSLFYGFAATSDGAQAAWVDGYDATAGSGDVYVGTPDGYHKTKVLSSACAPQVLIRGQNLFVLHCAGDDTNLLLSVVDLTSQELAPSTLFDHLPTYPVDSLVSEDGTRVFAAQVDGSGELVVVGGARTLIDQDVSIGWVLRDHSVVYETSGGALERWTEAEGATIIVSSGLGSIQSVSHDQMSLIFSPAGAPRELYLQSLSGGSPVLLSANGRDYSSNFTSNDAYAIFCTDEEVTNQSCSLRAVPVAGGPPRLIEPAAHNYTHLGGSKLLVSANWSNDNRAGSLEIVDLAKNDPPTPLLADNNGEFWVTSDFRSFVFVVDSVSGREGIYRYDLPQ